MVESWEVGKLLGEVMIVYVEFYKGVLECDNNVCFDFKLEGYVKLCLVFDKKYGLVIVVNVIFLIDGVFVVVMMIESCVKVFGYILLGYIKSYVFFVIDVWEDMLMGFFYVMLIVFDCVGMILNDLMLIEMYEVFVV